MLKPALIVVIVAVVGYLVWERHFSQGGRIESAYRTCMTRMGAAVDKANTPAPPAGDPASAIAKGVGDAMTSMLQGLGGAMCGVMKDACTKDFDGQICQTALRHYK